MFRISRLRPDQWDEAARTIHGSLRDWYGRHLNRGDKFGDDWRGFRAMPEIYESLDPGCCVTACDSGDGRLLGVCFYHPRETHVAVGIVSTATEAAGRGVARAMMEAVLRVADDAGLPVRLVSSAMNLDSFSLYTRLGFVPHTVFQDMVLPDGPPGDPPEFAGRIRPGSPADAPAMADLEFRLCGIRRESDYVRFLTDDSGIWHVRVAERPDGALAGFLCSVDHPGSNMIGPGVAEEETGALALLHAQLSLFPGRSPVFLVPAGAAGLVRSLYARGARNVELHVAQTRGHSPPMRGIAFPTFMPETG